MKVYILIAIICAFAIGMLIGIDQLQQSFADQPAARPSQVERAVRALEKMATAEEAQAASQRR